LQEALNNIARHAKAQNVVITFTFAADRLSIEVEDDGEGFDVSEVEGATDRTRGLGLLGMRERASLLGGSLRIESQPGSGTVIQVLVPLEGGGGDEQGAGSNR
ncbi:MAG TPA: ATP-binding protein, partial [Dehalococcoidia bacterium]|nr:ATP-binding protein [Dehalococcoidia bacterium]